MIKKPIDITLTATNRPKLLNRTLRSFRRNVIDTTDDFRLIINVDNIGSYKSPGKVIGIAKQYFQNCIYNISETPSFPKAIKYCWSNVKSDLFFHIEDDWLFLRKIDPYVIINRMLNNKKIGSIRFSKYRKVRNNGCDFTRERSFGTSPSITRAAFIRQALPLISDYGNPEKQFNPKNKELWKVHQKYVFQQYYFYGQRIIKDIGRKWMVKNNLVKVLPDAEGTGKKYFTSAFTSWEEIKWEKENS